jgi:hypothetical protein
MSHRTGYLWATVQVPLLAQNARSGAPAECNGVGQLLR